MATDIKEALVGSFVILIIAGMLMFPYGKLVTEATSNDILVTATFNKVDGLAQGDEVRLGGIRIGTIEAMDLDSNYRAVVAMRIDGDIHLSADTSAAIHTDGLFGSKFMVLEPGGDKKILASGDRIRFTQDAMIVSDLLDLIITRGRARLGSPSASESAGTEGGTR